MQERNHHPAGPVGVAIALAAAAGFVDAHIYVNVTPVFVANMSGNLIHLGIFLGSDGWKPAVATGVALAAFVAGVVIATVHHDRQVARARSPHPSFLLSIEAGLILALSTWLIVAPIPFAASQRARDFPVLALGALAMGLQAGALRRVGEVAVATTYGTGAIVRIGEKAVLAARHADRPSQHRRRVTIALLVAIIVSYVAGAIAATLAGASPRLLLAPTVVLIACAAITARRDATDRDGPQPLVDPATPAADRR
ncbi:MAG: YoaK family protein [Acidimicrobiales bacterium]